jgi:hypothetical protein
MLASIQRVHNRHSDGAECGAAKQQDHQFGLHRRAQDGGQARVPAIGMSGKAQPSARAAGELIRSSAATRHAKGRQQRSDGRGGRLPGATKKSRPGGSGRLSKLIVSEVSGTLSPASAQVACRFNQAAGAPGPRKKEAARGSPGGFRGGLLICCGYCRVTYLSSTARLCRLQNEQAAAGAGLISRRLSSAAARQVLHRSRG